jgi:hypothetical protein
MSTRKTPQRMTKKQFVKIVVRGTLSADQVIGKMVDELQLYERHAFRGFLCADSRDARGGPAGLSQLGDLLSELFSRFAKQVSP